MDDSTAHDSTVGDGGRDGPMTGTDYIRLTDSSLASSSTEIVGRSGSNYS